MLTQIYKSSRKTEMYLYVEKSRGLEAVPEALLKTFGDPEPIMLLMLDAKRTLARVDADLVRQSLQEHGYFLQLPPTPTQLLARERSDG
ncbi:YcgL domain-containing protein [Halieaceae bacterium IMCC14734]|uniref:YcgL domain-containing protein EYC98_11285 n=1 Tax=Candidatus Litorirhabdus singularis TaxID=2518993 RepID=A0ABT3TGL0_9GAMM|nr:YcgL domain-containing protein [Candidatus Litorirhabdus singularis]MCX2981446.1 YcgL domain-containing protein [Candidatus Litorirhabdus singularis]